MCGQAGHFDLERERINDGLLLVHDMFVGSLPAVLGNQDRSSMRFSPESQVPFLDLSLVRRIFGPPDEALIEDGWDKRILRGATVNLLPPPIKRRRHKIGFTAPQTDWFSERREFIHRIFLFEPVAHRPYCDQPEVPAAFQQWLNGSGQHQTPRTVVTEAEPLPAGRPW